MSIDSWIQIVIALLAALAIIVSCLISISEMKNANKVALQQSRCSFFAEYTRRYQEIIISMPDDVIRGTATIDSTTLKYMQLYFDLCSEEYHLYKMGQIPDDVWDNWQEGMRLTTKLPLYSDCWRRLGGIYNDAFSDFMEHEILCLGQSDSSV